MYYSDTIEKHTPIRINLEESSSFYHQENNLLNNSRKETYNYPELEQAMDDRVSLKEVMSTINNKPLNDQPNTNFTAPTFSSSIMNQASQDRQPLEQLDKETKSNTHKVLVVDDEKAMVAMAKAILKSSDYIVYESYNGEDALKLYQAHMNLNSPIHAVVLDITMPGGMSGVDTLKEILKIDPKAKVIAASGYLETNSTDKCLQLGFKGILPKPYSAERLIQIIKWLIKK